MAHNVGLVDSALVDLVLEREESVGSAAHLARHTLKAAQTDEEGSSALWSHKIRSIYVHPQW